MFDSLVHEIPEKLLKYGKTKFCPLFFPLFVNYTVEIRNVTICADREQTGQWGKQGQKPQKSRLEAA